MPGYLFLMDPIESIDLDGDSTFVLMLEAQKRGHTVYYAHPNALQLRGREPFITAQKIEVRRKKGDHFTVQEPECFSLNDLDAVFMRKDPPFDVNFLIYTYVLERVDQNKVVMVNNPQALRDFNEKLSAMYWPEVMPQTMVTADRKALRAFIEQHQEVVVKPLSEAGGSGIIRLVAGDKNIGSVLDLLTQEGKRMIEAQGFIAAVEAGDKRVILLDGEPIGAVNRVPAKDDIRANMHVGGAAQPIEVSERDREISALLAPELKKRGLIFVGIDIIGGYLTEVNVTSPTGLQEINRFNNTCLEAQIIDCVETKSKSRKKAE